jgi:hypothetical protein
MRRFARFAVAVVGIASLSGVASAASIQLTTDTMVSPGVFQIDMWLQMASPVEPGQAIQFDIEVDTPKSSLASPSVFRSSNAFLRDNDDQEPPAFSPPLGGPNGFPFDLNSSVSDPTGSIDVRVVQASSSVWDINILTATKAAYPNCSGSACPRQDAGLALGRVYLGSFNLNIPNGVLVTVGPAGGSLDVVVTIPVASVFGEDDNQPQDPTDDLVLSIRQALGNGQVVIQGVAPEPAGLALLALALSAVGLVRRRG